jgi:hypothetical protein
MKRVNNKIKVGLTMLGAVALFACAKSWLNVPPTGALAPTTLATKPGVEALLIGAYAILDGQGGAGQNNGPWATASSNWVYGSTAGGDAHKGSDPGDQNLITPIETWSANAANNYLEDLWQARFDGVQRANEAIRVMRLAKDMTAADTVQVKAEALFLRAHYHFELAKFFGSKWVPYIDESVTYSAGNYYVANGVDILPNLEADMTYAYNNLPEKNAQIGRATKWSAAAYLARILLFEGKFSDARTLLTTFLANAVNPNGVKYGLVAHFGDNFNPAKKNSIESVFAVQMSVNDGAGANNANAGDVLNFPYTGGPGGCCGFFQPSYSLVNSFKTDAANGYIPFLNGDYNNSDLKNDEGISSSDPFTPDGVTPVDPRVDWTAGRRGIPYLDWGPFPGSNWIRNQASAGPYAPIKNVYYKSQQGVLTDNSSWTSGYTANNNNLIRYSDVLLMAAEAEVQGGGSSATAMGYVNQVRQRAMDPTGFVPGSPANYMVGLYTAGTWTGNELKAIYFERKIELAMEGGRFSDLVRWGTAAAELNAYAAHEAASNYFAMKGASFTPGKSDYLPIPQAEIDKTTKGGTQVLQQNPAY